MYAIQIIGDKLVWKNIANPVLNDGEALINVKTVGVNRADILQRKGLYPPPKGASEILGLELSGEIEKIKRGSKKWKIGDKVMALVSGGAYAVLIGLLGGVKGEINFAEILRKNILLKGSTLRNKPLDFKIIRNMQKFILNC